MAVKEAEKRWSREGVWPGGGVGWGWFPLSCPFEPLCLLDVGGQRRERVRVGEDVLGLAGDLQLPEGGKEFQSRGSELPTGHQKVLSSLVLVAHVAIGAVYHPYTV